jgi:hypothetical protein
MILRELGRDKKGRPKGRPFESSGNRNRTYDTTDMSRLLYQLSYAAVNRSVDNVPSNANRVKQFRPSTPHPG